MVADKYTFQVLQVFESHAEHLGPQLFRDFALPYLKQICDQVKERVQKLGLPDIPMVSCRLSSVL